MGKKKAKKELLSRIRAGIRLRVKPPKEEIPKGVYCRKPKHKRRLNDETSSFFCAGACSRAKALLTRSAA
jgi:hypothetical protein